VTAWDDLKTRLLELEDEDCLLAWSNPRSEASDHQQPFQVCLQPWGTGIAEELHRKLGNAVELQVGAMTYPDRHFLPSPEIVLPWPSTVLDPEQLTDQIEGPREVQSGRDLDTGLNLHNLTDIEVTIHTQGEWTDTRLVDLATGDIVGGYRGYIPRPMIRTERVFQLPAQESVLIPVTVGTASTVPELGYAVPAGEWGLVVYLAFEMQDQPRGPWMPAGKHGEHDHRRTPPMPFTVT
jgi:hypothetical protein